MLIRQKQKKQILRYNFFISLKGPLKGPFFYSRYYCQPNKKMKTDNRPVSIFNIAVIVASLGYFVDIYDLLLFTIVRVPSLKSLGVPQSEIDAGAGMLLINIQMLGLLIGGIFWVLSEIRKAG